MRNYIELSPSPISLIESLRNIGYSMETAIADVIDNSITANATQIHIRFSWDSGNPWLAIIDNGHGMTKDELINAMRFGSMNPLEARASNDLGRFGLGMKTASLSQCRHLTVLSQKNRQVSCCEWDLNKLSRADNPSWNLGVLDSDAIKQYTKLDSICKEAFTTTKSGTIVFWEDMDTVTEQSMLPKQESHFNAVIDDARKHLELVFHRFLSPDTGKKKVTILMNGGELEAFNPFNPRNLATQELEKQQIFLGNEEIVVQAYVLPHHNKISRQEYDKYAGKGGYLHNQGFYVYRNKRLIIKGTWFRLIKKEELNKLIRIRVDIPNTLDHLWKIDVKKSHAVPSEIIKNELNHVIRKIEMAGRRVYHQRGAKLSTDTKSPVWNRKAVGGTIVYQINREHPLVVDLLEKIPVDQKEFLQHIITMFENSFPVDLFFNDIASKPEQVERPGFDERALEMLLDVFVESWVSSGMTNKELVEELLSVDPFASNKSLTEELIKRKGDIYE